MTTAFSAHAGRTTLAALVPLLLFVSGSCDSDSVQPSSGSRLAARDEDLSRNDNPVIRWADIARREMVDPGPIIDSRAFAILFAAIHDAVNGVDPHFTAYSVKLGAPHASLDAAVAAAAHDVLVTLSPSRREQIEAAYQAELAEVRDSAARARGVELGQQAAKANLERRAGDGIPIGPWPPTEGQITQPVYQPTGLPGNYAFTPPFDAPPLGPIALFPGWGRLTPFMARLGRHRAPGPLPLKSARYAADLDSVRRIGSFTSAIRTEDQTEIARFWFEEFTTWDQIAIDAVRRHRLDPWRAARVLAQVHFAMADAGIACFKAKYRFATWRPFTAIRQADRDGNPATAPDSGWVPLLWSEPGELPPRFFIPPIPEYPSAAATISAAAAAVLIRHFGDREEFEAVSVSLPGVTRHYSSFTEAARENGMSRVYGGIHFLHAVQDGYQLGRGIGREVSEGLGARRGQRVGLRVPRALRRLRDRLAWNPAP